MVVNVLSLIAFVIMHFIPNSTLAWSILTETSWKNTMKINCGYRKVCPTIRNDMNKRQFITAHQNDDFVI